MTDSDPAAPAGACIECGKPLVGRYCHVCGQDNARAARPLGDLLRTALSENFNLDGQVFATLKAMVAAPGTLLAAYRDGRTQAYVSPIKLFLVVSAAFFVVLIWADLSIYQFLPVADGAGPIGARLVPDGVALINGEMEDVYLRPAGDGSTAARLLQTMAALKPEADVVQARAIDDFSTYIRTWNGVNGVLNDWLPRLLWLLMPAYALLLWAFWPRRGFAEHVLFAIWAHTVIFVLLMGFALLNRVGLNLSFWWLTLPYLGYFTLAARRYYASRWPVAAVKGLAHGAAFFFLIWAPIVLALGYWAAGDGMPSTVFRADGGEGVFAFRQVVLAPEDAAAVRAGREPAP